MKNLIYTLVIPVLFVSCQKAEVPPNEPYIPDPVYTYEIRMIETNLINQIDSMDQSLNIGYDSFNQAFPDAPWTAHFLDFYSNSAINEGIAFPIDTVGNFSFGFLYNWNIGGYSDTIYGSGYFDADTLYMEYTYEGIDNGNVGHVTIHSY